ncbi:MAG: hypothetical protein N2C14_12765, partial [Planctomycetales bacterium]
MLNDLSQLLHGEDLTRHWVENPTARLEFDFDACSLGGVPAESPFDQLNWLGPATYRSKHRDREQIFRWHAKG